MEQLGLSELSNTNTTLHQFENALAHMTALMYWAGMAKHFMHLPSSPQYVNSVLAAANIPFDPWNSNGNITATGPSVHQGSALVSSTMMRLNVRHS